MSESATQLVVLGAGPGGYAAAFRAADLGLQVTLVDPEPNPGGVCLYRGCIPSKALLHVAELLEESERAADWGIHFDKPRIDLNRLRSWKNEVVAKMTGGLGQLNRARKVRYIQGRAAFVGPRDLVVRTVEGEDQPLSFEHAIVATGSTPTRIPVFPESDRIWDSTTALEINEIPEKLLVVGGGYIGLELGSVYAALGSKVTVVEMTDGLLPGADRDLVRPLAKAIEPRMEQVLLGTKVAEIKEQKNGLRVTLEGKEVEKKIFDAALVSVGRRPNGKGIGLENTRAVVDDHGFVGVDGQQRTSEPSIFAIGDVVGQPMLAHKASYEAHVAVETIAGHKVENDYAAIPAVVFTDPELAWAGLTETEAKERGIEVEVTRFPWAASGRATTLGREDGLTKLIVEPKTERLLGMGIVGPGAGEMIAEGVLAIEMAAVVSDIAQTIHPHPTLSETVMESAEVFFGQATHVHRPKKRA